MDEVVGVQFRTTKNIIYFEKKMKDVVVGDSVICKTNNGLEMGKVVCFRKKTKGEYSKDSEFFLRKATIEDLNVNQQNLEFEKKAFRIGVSCIKKQKLKMKLVLVVSTFERTKVLFFFISQERVDFRNLVRNLAFFFHARVELKPIGSRDEAKMVCGIGICGRAFCCCSFMKDFHHVSIKMAKEQNLSLNPKKISGCCGKLMCCLQYEQSSYDFLNKICPKIGDVVMSPDGEAKIVNGNPLTGKYRVKLINSNEEVEKVFNRDSLKIIKDFKNYNLKK